MLCTESVATLVECELGLGKSAYTINSPCYQVLSCLLDNPPYSVMNGFLVKLLVLVFLAFLTLHWSKRRWYCPEHFCSVMTSTCKKDPALLLWAELFEGGSCDRGRRLPRPAHCIQAAQGWLGGARVWHRPQVAWGRWARRIYQGRFVQGWGKI